MESGEKFQLWWSQEIPFYYSSFIYFVSQSIGFHVTMTVGDTFEPMVQIIISFQILSKTLFSRHHVDSFADRIQ